MTVVVEPSVVQSFTTRSSTAVTAPRKVLRWLMESDPAIRWQVLRDLTDASEAAVTAERARVASEGWGARLLDMQRADGTWSDDDYARFWMPTIFALDLLALRVVLVRRFR